ncbi:cupredoxin domain-containing protein [Methylibium sp.]|uniref:cupredoxin domain-containing protein n=1 Tax=Methylibium sp. TaxID=2067992 RepID=UPI003D0F633D
MKPLKTLAFAVIALSASTVFAHGDEHAAKKPAYDASKIEERAFGREGDPRKVSRTVRLDMTDAYRFTPADVTVKRGETVKFVVANSGKVLHEMVLGTTEELKEHADLMKKFPDMEHADANMAHVKPGAKGEIVWQFTKAGEYQFACLIPGHYEAGMVGKVVVK